MSILDLKKYLMLGMPKYSYTVDGHVIFTHCPQCWVIRTAAPAAALGLATAFSATRLDICRLGLVSAKSRFCKLKSSWPLAKT